MPENPSRRPAIAGVALSPLCFGSMRIHTLGDVARAARLIEEAVDLGVTTFHISSEYESWPFFVEAWRRAGRAVADARVVGKVASPHFGESAFDTEAFRAKIEGYRQALSIDALHVAQWLLRHDLKDEDGRQRIFRAGELAIAETVGRLRADGVIGGLVSFPYSQGVAELAMSAPWCDGLAVYCNPLEMEMARFFPAIEAAGKAVIAIRPFAAGKVFEAGAVQSGAEAIRFALAQPAVASVVLSVSDSAHLREAVSAATAEAADVLS